MLKRIQKRIQKRKRNRRPPSADTGLINWPVGYVPNDGFEWIEGQCCPQGRKEWFLIPSCATGTCRDVPADLYLQFQQLAPTREATLEFANRFGSLGLVKRHFHSEHTKIQRAESLRDWFREIEQLKTCLSAWRIIKDQDRGELVKFIREHRWPFLVRTDGPFLTAKCYIIIQINFKLNPDPVPLEKCSRKVGAKEIVPPKLTPFVTYGLNFANRSANHTLPDAIIEARVIPTALLSAIWLQFAEWVTESRVVRPCEKCHQLMDITGYPRKGAKRMHERCSLALRMSRYRLRKRERSLAH